MANGQARASTRKVLLVASSGGHLTQLQMLEPCFADDERVWVTFDHPSVDVGDDEVVYAYSPTTRNIPNLLRNIWLAIGLLVRKTPDVIVSNGAGVAVPFFILGRLLGARTVYIEVYDRIDNPTMTGRICRPFSDDFLLQWPEQQAAYGGGTLVGALY